MTTAYVPIPVEAAREIADRFTKQIVALVTYDRAFDQTHVTTYGRSAVDKISAARLGEILTKAAGIDSAGGVTYEDFRLRTAAQWAKEREDLRRACTAADYAIASLIAVRDGMPDEALIDIRKHLRAALNPTDVVLSEVQP